MLQHLILLPAKLLETVVYVLSFFSHRAFAPTLPLKMPLSRAQVFSRKLNLIFSSRSPSHWTFIGIHTIVSSSSISFFTCLPVGHTLVILLLWLLLFNCLCLFIFIYYVSYLEWPEVQLLLDSVLSTFTSLGTSSSFKDLSPIQPLLTCILMGELIHDF